MDERKASVVRKTQEGEIKGRIVEDRNRGGKREV